MKKIDFFIAGVQKGGTTALDGYLRRHSRIQMAAVKEVHFFDNEALAWPDPDYERLRMAFDWSRPDVVRGEATPVYIYWPHALDRLHRYNSKARIIVGLRHPAFRAYSHWRMETKRGDEALSFGEAIREPARRRVAEAPNGAHRVHSYVERGFYAGQIERLLALFPRQQVLFFRTDTLWTDPAGLLGRIHDFIGGERQPVRDSGYIAPVMTWVPEGPPASDRAYLDALYASDIDRTARATGLDLADWLEAGYHEPMQPK